MSPFLQRMLMLVVGVALATLANTLLADSPAADTLNAAAVALITFGGGALVGAGMLRRPGDSPGKPPTSALLVFAAALLLGGCSSTAFQKARDASSTVMDVARTLCLSAGVERTGLSFEDVHREFCRTREQLEPWIGAARQAQATGAMRAGMVPDGDGQ